MLPSTSSGFTEIQPEMGSSQLGEALQSPTSCLSVGTANLLEFFREEDAATAVEYAVMIALIAGTIIAGFQALTTATLESFETSSDELSQ